MTEQDLPKITLIQESAEYFTINKEYPDGSTTYSSAGSLETALLDIWSEVHPSGRYSDPERMNKKDVKIIVSMLQQFFSQAQKLTQHIIGTFYNTAQKKA